MMTDTATRCRLCGMPMLPVMNARTTNVSHVRLCPHCDTPCWGKCKTCARLNATSRLVKKED